MVTRSDEKSFESGDDWLTIKEHHNDAVDLLLPRVAPECCGEYSSAANRSIGFTIGFHNHGEGLGPSPG